MKKISKKAFKASVDTIMENGRELEKAIINLQFFDGTADSVIQALQEHQNDDGGFGGGIESDFTLPLSSPMATSVGLRIISNYCQNDLPTKMIKKSFQYLKSVFNEKENRWFAVPPQVNDFPHAPWWHFREDINMTVIDYSWGNPTAELIAYLLEFHKLVDGFDVDALNQLALEKLESKTEFQSEHEIYCYIPLYDKQVEQSLKERYEKKIKEAVEQLLCKDPEKWFSEYLPKPLDFVNGKDSNFFDISEALLNKNLDMVVEFLEQKGEITPTWKWGQYEESWKEAERKWVAELTKRALIQLKAFDRI